MKKLSLLFTLSFASPILLASEVAGINTFSADTPASASQVNENFDILTGAINDNNSRISTLENSPPSSYTDAQAINAVTTSDAFNAKANVSQVNIIENTLGAHSTSIADHSTRIQNLENTPPSTYTDAQAVSAVTSSSAFNAKANASDVTALENTVNSHNTRIQALENAPPSSYTDAQAINAVTNSSAFNAKANDSDLTILENTVGNNTTMISNNTTRIQALENNPPSTYTDAQAINAVTNSSAFNAKAEKTAVNAVAGDVIALENTVGSHSTTLTNHNSRIQTLENNPSSTYTDAQAISAVVGSNELTTEVNNLTSGLASQSELHSRYTDQEAQDAVASTIQSQVNNAISSAGFNNPNISIDQGGLNTYSGSSIMTSLSTNSGQGSISTFHTNGSSLINLQTYSSSEAGLIQINNSSGIERINIAADSFDDGFMRFQNRDNKKVVEMNSTVSGQGVIYVNNNAGTNTLRLGNTTSGDGLISIKDSLGSTKVEIGIGGITMFNAANQSATNISTNYKSSIMPHPTDPASNIVYVSLEGPEAGMYIRGTAILDQGISEIELPEHFSLFAAKEGMTVSLTPHSTDSLGLARSELTPNLLRVAELQNGSGTYEFDYVIHAVRKGHESYKTIQKKSNLQFKPAYINNSKNGLNPAK